MCRINHVCLSDRFRYLRIAADGARDDRLQDEAFLPNFSDTTQHTEPLSQRVVEYPRLQAIEGFLKI